MASESTKDLHIQRLYVHPLNKEKTKIDTTILPDGVPRIVSVSSGDHLLASLEYQLNPDLTHVTTLNVHFIHAGMGLKMSDLLATTGKIVRRYTDAMYSDAVVCGMHIFLVKDKSYDVVTLDVPNKSIVHVTGVGLFDTIIYAVAAHCVHNQLILVIGANDENELRIISVDHTGNIQLICAFEDEVDVSEIAALSGTSDLVRAPKSSSVFAEEDIVHSIKDDIIDTLVQFYDGRIRKFHGSVEVEAPVPRENLHCVYINGDGQFAQC